MKVFGQKNCRIFRFREYYSKFKRRKLYFITTRFYERNNRTLSDQSSLAAWLLSKEAGKSVKVILSGDGGDELFDDIDGTKSIKHC